MIIDGHAYCFPPLGEANGFPSAAEHLRYVQREMADHHQPVWRLRDRALAGDNSMLAGPGDDGTIAALSDVGFRSGGHGRLVWTVDGEDYAKQYLPPYTVDSSHSPETLVAQMDYLGVDRAVLHTNPILGLLNDYTAECVRRFPDRLIGLASVKEWEIDTDPEGQGREVERCLCERTGGAPVRGQRALAERELRPLGRPRLPDVLGRGRRARAPGPVHHRPPRPGARARRVPGTTAYLAGLARALPGGAGGAHPRVSVAAVHRRRPARLSRCALRALPGVRSDAAAPSTTSRSGTSGTIPTWSSVPRRNSSWRGSGRNA